MNNYSNMNKPRKFVYTTGSNSAKSKNYSEPHSHSTSTDLNLGTSQAINIANDADEVDEFDDFQLDLDLDDDDDITSTMSEAELQRLEYEASKKLGLQPSAVGGSATKSQAANASDTFFLPIASSNKGKFKSSVKQEETMDTVAKSPPSNVELQQLSLQLEEYRSKMRRLESSLCDKDGELKLLRFSLEQNRKQNIEKSETIIKLKNKQTADQNQREANLMKEVASLKTRLSFQEQELKQSKQIQSQKKSFNVTGSVKRKAELGVPSSSFDLDNSFLASQPSTSKKIPRIAERTSHEPTAQSYVTKEEVVKTDNSSKSEPVKRDFVQCPSKEFHLVKQLILMHPTSNLGDQNGTGTISLLSLLKHPLKYLPEVLKAHSINTCVEEQSQFPVWQSQKLHLSPDAKSSSGEVLEYLDLDSGKYGFVSQGIFMLLGLNGGGLFRGSSGSYDEIRPSLGVVHILVLLELYISSYLMSRESEANNSDQDKNADLTWEPSKIFGEKAEDDWHKSILEQEMIIQTLQILKLLMNSAPSVVNCIVDRTNPSAFASNDDDVIIIDDDSPEQTKEVPAKLNTDVIEDEIAAAMGSFQSLLLSNLEKLIVPQSGDDTLTVPYAALNVMIAMTSICEKTELESIFLVLKRGCLYSLLTKDSGMSTILPIMALLKNFLPCKDINKVLCSQTDDCILLKIYQCACDEEVEDGTSHEVWTDFLFQVMKFLTSVAFSHDDSITFLLESDCQCSFEVVRCLVLILHDRIIYLLDLDTEVVTSDKSLDVLRIGMTLLVILCTHTSYSTDHKLDVEHYYVDLIYKTMILYKNIRRVIPDHEALGVQDLLDMEQIEEIEWCSESDDDDDCMEVEPT